MWVSSEKWARLERRIEELERLAKQAPEAFEVYDPVQYERANSFGLGYPWHMIDKQRITVKDAVARIMAHLGLKLVYVKGTPTTLELRSAAACTDTKEKS